MKDEWSQYAVKTETSTIDDEWAQYAEKTEPTVSRTSTASPITEQPKTAMQKFLGHPVVKPIAPAIEGYMGYRNMVGNAVSSIIPDSPNKVQVPSFIPNPFLGGSFQVNTPMTGKELGGEAGRILADEVATFGAGKALKAIGRTASYSLSAGKSLARGISKIPSDIEMVRRGAQIESAPLAFQKYINDAKSLGKTAIENARISFKDSNISLSKKLQTASETGGRQVQADLAKNLKAVSPKYGARLDEAFSKASGKIKNSEAVEIGESTLAELRSKELGNPDVEEIIQGFIDKVTAVKTSPIVDEFGKPITSSVRNAEDAIDFQELNNLRTKVMGELSTRGKKLGDYNQADLASIIFNRNMTEKMATHVPELQSIRGEYANFKKIAEEAYKIVRPKKGEYNTRGIENLIKRNALGKASAGERDLIKAIQEGTDLLPGSKDFSSEAKKFGDELLKLKSEQPKKLLAIERQTRAQVESLQAEKNLAKEKVKELKRAQTKLKWIAGLLTSGTGVAGYQALSR